MRSFWWSVAAGIASVLAGVGAAELVSAFVVQNGSPILVVGALLIDLAPGWVKQTVIALFGTGDKAFLIVLLVLIVLIGSGLAGWLELRRPPWGRVLIGVGGAVGVVAALTRSGASIVDAVPSALAAVVAVLLLGWLVGLLRGTVPTQAASGAFMVLHAHENAKLVGVSSPVGDAEIHEMKMENNVMRMRQIKSLDLPRMQNVELKPGGYHVMLMGLKSQLKKGDTVPLTLKIEQGGKVTEQKVNAEVRDMVPGGSHAGHASHGEHKH